MKKAHKSKTLIFNTAALLVGVSTQVAGLPISEEYTKIALAIIAIGNIILRFKTTEPIK